MDERPVPLDPADQAILDIECETIAGHTCKVIRIGGPAPGVDEIRARVAERIASVPAMATRLDDSGGAPAWVPWEGFDPRLRVVAMDGQLSETSIADETAKLFEQRLDRSRPLWQMHVGRLREGGTVVVWRIHHALADGTAAMRFARELLFDRELDPGDVAEAKRAHDHSHPDEVRRRRHLAGFINREFGESMRRSPFDGKVGTKRRIAFASIELAPLHDAAKRVDGATVNDAVLAVVAGAMRRWLEHHHGSLGAVRVRVPVSLHHEGDAAANLDSFFSLRLPLGVADPRERLRRVHAETLQRKEAHDAEELQEVLSELGSVSPRMRSFCERLESSPRSFCLCVSNVPGPRQPVRILGAPVDAIHSIAEIGSRHALRVAVVSLAGRLHFGFCADPALVADLDAMAEGIELEASLLESVS
jgi:diacylglycerol O-acyltransferase